MGNASDSEVMTLAEYLATPETSRRRELAWGVLREPPAPTWDHQSVVGRLFAKLDAHVARFTLGKVGVSPVDVILDPERPLVVQPDVFFIAADRCGIIRDQVWGAPDLAIEVLSHDSHRYDREQKRSWYARYGVRELWLVDPDARRIAICDLVEAAREPVEFEGTQVVRSRVLSGLRLRVSSAFEGCTRSRSLRRPRRSRP